jgi:DNA-binding response OmpR family regulator
MTILLLEDDELVAKILSFHLQEAGHKVILTLSGDEAVELFQSNSIDLIISDIMMPNNSGMTAIRLIQSIPNNVTPVIIMSGIENSTFYLNNRNIKYHSFIKKPFSIDVLLSKIDSIASQLIELKD